VAARRAQRSRTELSCLSEGVGVERERRLGERVAAAVAGREAREERELMRSLRGAEEGSGGGGGGSSSGGSGGGGSKSVVVPVGAAEGHRPGHLNIKALEQYLAAVAAAKREKGAR
jgi:hypothetical protein